MLTYRELLAHLKKFTPEELDKEVGVFVKDEGKLHRVAVTLTDGGVNDALKVMVLS